MDQLIFGWVQYDEGVCILPIGYEHLYNISITGAICLVCFQMPVLGHNGHLIKKSIHISVLALCWRAHIAWHCLRFCHLIFWQNIRLTCNFSYKYKQLPLADRIPMFLTKAIQSYAVNSFCIEMWELSEDKWAMAVQHTTIILYIFKCFLSLGLDHFSHCKEPETQ